MMSTNVFGRGSEISTSAPASFSICAVCDHSASISSDSPRDAGIPLGMRIFLPRMSPVSAAS